jgi:hypothetical protein
VVGAGSGNWDPLENSLLINFAERRSRSLAYATRGPVMNKLSSPGFLAELIALAWCFVFPLMRPLSESTVRAVGGFLVAVGPYLVPWYYWHRDDSYLMVGVLRALVLVGSAREIRKSVGDAAFKPGWAYVEGGSAVLVALVSFGAPEVIRVPLALVGGVAIVGIALLHGRRVVRPSIAVRWCGAVVVALFTALTLAEQLG